MPLEPIPIVRESGILAPLRGERLLVLLDLTGVAAVGDPAPLAGDGVNHQRERAEQQDEREQSDAADRDGGPAGWAAQRFLVPDSSRHDR